MYYAKILIAILAVVGFIISYHIYKSKRKNVKLVCVIGQDCDKVVKSKYSKFFGVPTEIWGMIYYAAVFLFLFVFGCLLLLQSPIIIILFKIAVSFAALSSVALIFIQAFILKEWCEWCLGADFINILIFILVMLYF